MAMSGYMGDSGYVSLEGMDLCDPELGHSRIRNELSPLDPIPVDEAYALPFAFTADAVVQGVIMSEILTRPNRRRWVRM